MLEKYKPESADDYRRALKEIVQEVSLYGLSKSNFFQQGAFYGGTALRIFYNLPRFSEDMDFSLMKPDPKFDLAPYLDIISNELAGLGLEMTANKKIKNIKTDILSAFIKGGTLIQIIHIKQTENVKIPGMHRDEQLKIKLEVDINPPSGARYDLQYSAQPFPYAARLYDLPSLFAGKISAVLCRNWQHRVKGRDLYDYSWYLGQGVKFNIGHLQKRLEQSGHWNSSELLTLEKVKSMLNEHFNGLDFESAKSDVKPFIANSRILDIWDKRYFNTITKRLEAETYKELKNERV